MGRETKSFRQTKRSGGADSSAKNYAKINRQGSWGNKLGNLNLLKLNKTSLLLRNKTSLLLRNKTSLLLRNKTGK